MGDESGNTIDVDSNYGYGFDLKQGDQVMVGGRTNFDNLLTVGLDTQGIFNDRINARLLAGGAGTAATDANGVITVYAGAGKVASAKGQGVAALASDANAALYKVHNTKGYTNDNCDTQNMLAA